jgi:uncharacterized membrane protein YjfL (UPF0719 family)
VVALVDPQEDQLKGQALEEVEGDLVVGNKEMILEKGSLMEDYMSTDILWDLMDANAVVYLAAAIIIFFVGKKIYDFIVPYDMNKELVEVDNKAVAVSLSGYLVGLGIILWGVLGDTPEKVIMSKKDLQHDLLSVLLWGCIGILLLQIARLINDKIVLHKFNNIKEIVTDRNVGTGAVQFGAFIASALMIRGSLIGDGQGFGESVCSLLVFFFAGQIALFIYSKFYQVITRYDIHDEIEKDNIAAGVAFGLSLIAEGVLLSGYMAKHDSLIGLAAWFVIGTAALFIARMLVDKFILPGSLLDDEIQRDKNWGAAVIEGSTAIIFAFILNAAF